MPPSDYNDVILKNLLGVFSDENHKKGLVPTNPFNLL